MIRFYEVERWEREPIQETFPEAALVPQPLTIENVDDARDAKTISTFIYSMLNKDLLDRLPDLELIATRSTGFSHIDVEECSRRGIVVSYVPNYGDVTVAEHVFALALALAKNIVPAIDRTRRGEFSFSGLRGFEVSHKTIGIVGTGRIGMHVAMIARGFDMRIIGFDKFPNERAAQEVGLRYLPYDDVLRQADILTYHVPETPETFHMLNQDNIGLLKQNCIVINTARGSVIETRALVRALSEGRIAGAGLDVVEEEPVIREESELVSSLFHQTHDLGAILSGQILLRFNNVIITPHNAFNTNEAVRRILDTTVENIRAYLRHEPRNEVPVPAHA